MQDVVNNNLYKVIFMISTIRNQKVMFFSNLIIIMFCINKIIAKTLY